MRNPYRLFNHAELIREKKGLAEKWQLIPSVDSKAHIEVMALVSSLIEDNSSLDEVLEGIASINRRSVDALVEEMGRNYRTGLVELHITDRCDLDCVDCHYAHKTGATIDFDNLSMILNGLAPKAITITGGGEPNVYRSGNKTMNDVILLIDDLLPDAQIGIINNNTRIPQGDWTQHVMWQRSSIDAANATTYRAIKRLDKYDAVVANVEHMLHNTPIGDVGIGFLYRKENVHEVSEFLVGWFQWYREQPPEVQERFNIQFRPISPSIEQASAIIAGNDYLPGETIGTLRAEVGKVVHEASENPEYSGFLERATNFGSVVERSNQTNPFAHTPHCFDHCYNALIHRVFRANGDEYPDFLLCAFPEYSLGNTLKGDAEMQRAQIGLMQFFFYNKMSRFCNQDSCRQSLVSHIIENPDHSRKQTRPADNYFF
jgi:hypothetical protein